MVFFENRPSRIIYKGFNPDWRDNMAQLWGGRFTKETDQQVYDFNASISFDSRMYREDITGSIAHSKMLGKQGIISSEDMELIIKGLEGILSDIENGSLDTVFAKLYGSDT